MRFVYIDEAGTSENEPLTVVAGIVANADTHLVIAEVLIREVLGAVPKAFREGFVFHATDIWGSPKYRDDWSMADRLAMLKAMMSLPRRLGMTIVSGMYRRNSPVPPQGIPEPLTKAQWDHLLAFGTCICQADRYIRESGGPTEVGTVVAEDIPNNMKKLLKKTPTLWRDGFVFKPGNLRPTLREKELGHVEQAGEMRVSRIRDIVHFVEKGDDLMLQVVDAVAFGLRRYFSGQTFGPDFIKAILDFEPPLKDFDGPCNYTLWRPLNEPKPQFAPNRPTS